jgi:hypothetical protein
VTEEKDKKQMNWNKEMKWNVMGRVMIQIPTTELANLVTIRKNSRLT